MRTVIWFVVAAIIAAWSLICWLAYELVVAGGHLIAGNADLAPVPPEAIELISWLGLIGADAGGWLVTIVWGLVTAVVAGLGFIATRFLPR